RRAEVRSVGVILVERQRFLDVLERFAKPLILERVARQVVLGDRALLGARDAAVGTGARADENESGRDSRPPTRAGAPAPAAWSGTPVLPHRGLVRSHSPGLPCGSAAWRIRGRPWLTHPVRAVNPPTFAPLIHRMNR